MLRVVTSRLRLQWTRYALVVVCVAVSAAFVTAALGLASTLSASMAATAAAPFRNADAVVLSPNEEQAQAEASPQQLREIENLPGVEHAWAPHIKATVPAGTKAGPDGSGITWLGDLPRDTSLAPVSPEQGAFPTSPTQVLVSGATAEKLGVGVGDTMRLAQPDNPSGGPAQYTVSGITARDTPPGLPHVYATAQGLERVGGTSIPSTFQGSAVLLRMNGTPDQGRLDSLAPEVNRILKTGAGGTPALTVQTPEDVATQNVKNIAQGTNVLAVFLGLFAGLSVLVALLVVTNTLSVLTTQRARELALLRCVGATGTQLRRAVMLEGLVIGVVASALGVAGVVGLVALLRAVVSLGSVSLTLAPRDVIAGLVTGVLLALVASLGPARRARGAAALDGLRGSRSADGIPMLRVISGAVILVAGAGTLVFGALTHNPGLGIAGGLASFLGVVMTSRAYVPALVRGAGSVLPGGIASKLAATNAARYPGRTSTTATALLIGVLLVATVLTGQHVARVNLLDQLDRERPVDIAVPMTAGPLSEQQLTELRALPDVLGVQTSGDLPYGVSATIDAAQRLNVQEATKLEEAVAKILNVGTDQLGGALLEKAGYVNLLDILLAVVLALLAVAVVVSVLGIASTTSLSVLERSRENSLLRALGLSKRQLGALIRREALVISLVATVVGLVVGWLFGMLGVMSLVVEGMTVRPVVPWGGFLLILAGAVVVAVIASALPVRRATKLNPVEGLARVD